LTDKPGIGQFKTFLESILYPTDEHTLPRHRAILREFLESERPRDNDQDGKYFSSLLQAWDFSSSSTDDGLFSAVASILALLLKTISTHLDLRELGLGICKTLLRQESLKLVARGLSAPKDKARVISPCLRLLTEIVSFDGGALARQLYSKRDLTFDARALARNLALRGHWEGASDEDKQRPTVRSNAVRYVLANIKFQYEGAKMDILKQSPILRGLFAGIEEDPIPLMLDILAHLKSHILGDKSIPRNQKGYMFNERNLQSLYQLYRSELPEEPIDTNPKSAKEQVFDFVHMICTNPEAGLLRSGTGWYPPRGEKGGMEGDNDDLNLTSGHENFDLYGKNQRQLQIRNTRLADLAHMLRPYANDDERGLLMTIFRAAPELVADYYFKKRSFSFDPKLTATWIGYASVLFETVQLPVPRFFERREDYANLPPPISITIESIMPQPLTQKVLSRCIHNSSDLIKLFAIRIMALAFQKFLEVRKQFRRAAESQSRLWARAADALQVEFVRRCPYMNDVIAAFKKTPRENLIQREATARLLALYYDGAPQAALDEKFDVSVALTTALEEVEKDDANTKEHGIQLLELDHLIHVARWSPNVSWWKKPDSLRHSPFVTLLKLAAESKGENSLETNKVLTGAIRDTGSLQLKESPSSLDALIVSLKELRDSHEDVFDDILEWLDDCFQRLSKRPIKYQDDLDAMAEGAKGREKGRPVSLILVTLLEQWPHKQKANSYIANKMVPWLAAFLNFLRQIGENEAVLRIWQTRLAAGTTDEESRAVIEGAFDNAESALLLTTTPTDSGVQVEPTRSKAIPQAAKSFDITSLHATPEDPKHPALSRFQKASTDLQSYIEDGHISPLILYLSSPDLSIRRQALILLRQVTARVRNSTFIESSQTHLLLGELVETTQHYSKDCAKPLPNLTSTFATHALPLVCDPTSVLFPKICAFLMRRPSWNLSGMVKYFLEQILLHPPSRDAAESDATVWRELLWLLDWIYDGTRGPEDVDILRKTDAFERIMHIFNHGALQRYKRLEIDGADPGKESVVSGTKTGINLQAKVRSLIVKIIGRVVLVSGGATTLATRTGVLAWLKELRDLKVVDRRGTEILMALETEILQRCERERVREWSSGFLFGNGERNGVVEMEG
jgi:nucleolar pre-ribosomal-associated protein 1